MRYCVYRGAMPDLVVEHGESTFSRRLRRRRFAVAGVIAGVEAVLVLVDALPWWAPVLAAGGSVALYVGWARDHSAPIVRSAAWIAAASQLVVVLVPVAVVLVGLLALVGVVVLAAIALTPFSSTGGEGSFCTVGRGTRSVTLRDRVAGYTRLPDSLGRSQAVRQRALVP